MQHVADDADLDAVEPPEVVAQREHVEQPLRGMLVRAVAGVDDVRLDALGEELRRAGRAVADHDHVDPHRLEIARRVDERLALRHARPRRGDVHRVGRQALFGELERDARARRRLEEQVDDRRAAQRRHLLDRPLADLLERLGGVENQLNLLAAQRLEPQEILAERRASRRSPPRSAMTTPFAPVELLDEHVDALRTARPRSSCRRCPAGSGSSRPPRSIEHREGDAPRPAEVGELVERGANRPARVEHVVDDDDVLAVDVDRDLRLSDDRSRSDGLQVVAIERDVERALRERRAFSRSPMRGYDLRRELNAAALNADDDEIRPCRCSVQRSRRPCAAAFDRTLAHRGLLIVLEAQPW